MFKSLVKSVFFMGFMLLFLAVPVFSHAEEPSAASTQTTAPTTPAAPSVTQVRGGSNRVKVYWTKVENVSGYRVYMSDNSKVTYEKVAEITDLDKTMYIKTGLNKKANYFFYVTAFVKKADGSIIESAASRSVSAAPVSVDPTSKKPAKYRLQSNFIRSAAYRKYTGIKKNYSYKKSFAIPGLTHTNVGGFSNKNMVPQDICFAGGYVLISAYDRKGVDESVIYVLSKASKSYITTIVLPDKSMVSGLTYDGENLWMTGKEQIMSLPFSAVRSAVDAGGRYKIVQKYEQVIPLNMTTSFCFYEKNILWVGSYNTSAATYAYGFSIGSDGEGKTLTKKYYMTVPRATRSMSITGTGKMILTRSYRTTSAKSGYISQIVSYEPDFANPTATGGIRKGARKGSMKLPPLCSGVDVKGSYIYVDFSSVRYPSCKYPVDRVIALKLSAF